MPTLLCPSPVLLDQSFPRSLEELRLVAITLGELVDLWQEDSISILLTTILQDFIQELDLKRLNEPTGIFREIYTLLNQWFLTPRSGLVCIDVSSIQDYIPHPIPDYCTEEGLIEIWSDEIGKVLAAHNMCCEKHKYFIGIACHLLFSSLDGSSYRNNTIQPFPLVGPENLSELGDCYIWQTPIDLHQKSISFENARKNCSLLGGECRNPSRGSHYKVHFKSRQRPWVLDPNNDPIPYRYLKQLESITNLPIDVVKYVLLEGRFPKKQLRFNDVPSVTIISSP